MIEEVDFTDQHLDAVLALPTVDVEAIRNAHFKVALDAVNSVGGVIMPRLLERLGVECVCINCEPTGQFAHNPEPLPSNLVELCEAVVANKADFGISVDPDVDRLALICEDGTPFGEEYTLVSIADYLLSRVYNEALQSGKSIEETFPILKEQANVEIKGLMVSLNRMEVGLGGKLGALDEITEKYGFPANAIVSMAEVTEHLYNKPYKGEVYINDDMKKAIDAYYEQYGAK